MSLVLNSLRPLRRQIVCLRGFSAAVAPESLTEENFPQYRRALVKSMVENVSPVGSLQLVKLFQLAKDEPQLQGALKVLRIARRYRSYCQQHHQFPGSVGEAALQKALELGKPGVALSLLKSADPMGLQFANTSWHDTLMAYTQAGELRGLVELWRVMPKDYVKPEFAGPLIQTCMSQGHQRLAMGFVEEFERNGHRVPVEVLTATKSTEGAVA